MGKIFAEIKYQLRYRLPLWFAGFLTNWLPDNKITVKLRGFLHKPFFKKCGKNLTLGKGVIFASPHNIEIGDNGHGIGSSTDELDNFVAEGKLGIAGMKERVELLGGCFYVASDPSGTRIGLSIPLPISPAERLDDGPD